MKKNIAIKIENLSKQYRLGQVGTGTISHDLNRWWHQVRGKENPYLKLGESNDRSTIGHSEYVWALKDINFEVQQGEILGIIGKNGAGKSTLLKILSKVTGPTTGSIKAKGRIASLLEVGTGFHPEMTGRENIFMNGTIMGMNRLEINKKLDEIVAFAGIERYLDTPVKRYSSGMTVRLGFSIAAHLEPEILVVDEVLAVGDAEFQKKAIGKMQDVSKGEGRTVLFVSHNMASVRNLCTNGLVLNNGQIDLIDNIDNCINKYLSYANTSLDNKAITTSNGIKLSGLSIFSSNGKKEIESGTDCTIEFTIDNVNTIEYKNIRIVYDIIDQKGHHLFRLINQNDAPTFDLNANSIRKVSCIIPSIPLNNSVYYLSVRIKHGENFWINEDGILEFRVHSSDFFKTGKIDAYSGSILIKSNWSYS